MATVKELKATARPKSGKGAARAERRAGRVPGVIYGNNQPPLTISVDDRDLRQRILAGRFLTTVYDIDLEGKKHRVIPRDFHLDPVRDFPLHVDFMRLGEGATIRVSIPLHVVKSEPLALGSAAHQTRDIDKGQPRRNDLGGLGDFGKLVEPRIRNRDLTDIRFDGAERIVGRLRRRRFGQCIEQRRFADIGQPDDTAFKSH